MEKKDTKFKKGHKPSQKAIEANKAALSGNQRALKLTTEELKKEAYKQYCDHIASGMSKESWCFEHPELTLTFKTMERYIKDSPSEFPAIQKEMAETKSLQNWEKEGIMMMKGQVDKCQPAIFQMFMRNKFGWDKEQRVTVDVVPDFLKATQAIKDGQCTSQD